MLYYVILYYTILYYILYYIILKVALQTVDKWTKHPSVPIAFQGPHLSRHHTLCC